MLCCCRERKTEECGSVNSGSPNLRLRRSRHNFEHSSLSMSDAGACGGASRRLSVGSREHGPPSTSFLHRTCERQRVPGATILWGMGDERNRLSCPPNAITLSCKSRLPCLPQSGTVAAATDEWFGGSDVQLPWRRAVRSRPRRLRRRANGPAAFVSLWGSLGGLKQAVSRVRRRPTVHRRPGPHRNTHERATSY